MANLTSKELSALTDQIGQEQTLISKYRAMACLCHDQQLQQQLGSIAQKHKQHCDMLMSFLQ